MTGPEYSAAQEVRKGLRAASKALEEGRELVEVRRGVLQALRAIERAAPANQGTLEPENQRRGTRA